MNVPRVDHFPSGGPAYFPSGVPTVRRLFGHEPGVIVICTPRKGTRVYRTLRIPERVFRRVVMRLTIVD